MALNYDFHATYKHTIVFQKGLLHDQDLMAGLCPSRTGGPARGLLILDEGLGEARPDLENQILRALPLDWIAPTCVVPGGEVCKNDPTILDNLLQTLHDAHLCRQSFVVGAGGGALLDLAGLAAALTHRGLRLIRLPSTTLAQGDSGVGVKNGVNRFGKKNFLGTFATPWAVLCDPLWLTTLNDYEWRSGFSEAVKVALLKDPALFAEIERQADAIRTRDLAASMPILKRSAELHAEHITRGGDPFEDNIARPLDFGHWSAHKLEQISDYAIGHGHAVAMGLAIDVRYSVETGMLPAEDGERVVRCLQQLGFDLPHALLRESGTLLDGLEEFREHLGGPLTITLLEAIGKSVDVHEIDRDRMQSAIAHVGALQTSDCR